MLKRVALGAITAGGTVTLMTVDPLPAIGVILLLGGVLLLAKVP